MGPRGAVAPAQEGPQAADYSVAIEARGSLTPDEQFPHARRLTRPAEIRRVLEVGRRRRLSHLDVMWVDNGAGHPRLGLIVPTFQSTAVARNRLRRRIREIWRREMQFGSDGRDVVIRARCEAYSAGFQVLREELLGWLHTLPGC